MLDAGAKFFGLRSMPVDESWLNLIAVDELRCIISRWPTQRPKTNWKLQTTLFNSFGPGSLTVNDFFTWCTNEVLLHQRMNLLTNMGLMSLFAIATCLNYVTFFDGDPRVDGMWTVQNIPTKMKVSLTIPYSIYFRMIVYIYICD